MGFHAVYSQDACVQPTVLYYGAIVSPVNPFLSGPHFVTDSRFILLSPLRLESLESRVEDRPGPLLDTPLTA